MTVCIQRQRNITKVLSSVVCRVHMASLADAFIMQVWFAYENTAVMKGKCMTWRLTHCVDSHPR